MLCATTRHTREMILVNELVRSVIKRGNNLLPVFSISKKKKPCNACKGYSVPKGPQLDPYFDREAFCLTLVHIVGQIIVWPRLVVSEQGMVQHLPLGLLSSDLPLQLCFLVEVSHRKLNAITNQCVSLTIQRNLFSTSNYRGFWLHTGQNGDWWIHIFFAADFNLEMASSCRIMQLSQSKEYIDVCHTYRCNAVLVLKLNSLTPLNHMQPYHLRWMLFVVIALTWPHSVVSRAYFSLSFSQAIVFLGPSLSCVQSSGHTERWVLAGVGVGERWLAVVIQGMRGMCPGLSGTLTIDYGCFAPLYSRNGAPCHVRPSLPPGVRPDTHGPLSLRCAL